MTLLIMEAFGAAITGVLASVFLWMWCHRSIYSWRDFGVMLLLLLSMVMRFVIGNPPDSHFLGIMIMNLSFIVVAALIWARPSKIPSLERKADCFAVRIWKRLHGVLQRG